jgi:hypothetical protein
MKAYFGCAALMLAVVMTTAPADAKGCIKGAIVGGVAGHAAHHTFLGAATGCIVGHHLAKKHEQQAPAAGQDSNSAPAATAPTPTKQQ